MRSIILFLSIFFISSAAQAQVVVSIKPLHSLVLAVAEGSDIDVTLLVDGKTSLHEFSLKPSQAKKLHAARAVFYMSDELEQFLEKILPQLPATTKRVPMEEAKGLTLYPVRVGNGFEAHEDHHDEHEKHAHENHDLHAWMSPENARVMVKEIAAALSAIEPKQSAVFAANAKKLDAKLVALDTDLQKRMVKLKDKPFVVFHDAYQYFDRSYGLSNIGSITLHPEHGLSAKRVSELREQIKKSGATCVFREPEFEGKIVDNLMRGTNAKSGVLDPEGALLPPGKELYFELMEWQASSLENCLSS